MDIFIRVLKQRRRWEFGFRINSEIMAWSAICLSSQCEDAFYSARDVACEKRVSVPYRLVA